MTAVHHHGTCGCCGGHIPCGADYVRRWRASGECPGHVTSDGMCGALLDARPRKREIVGETKRAEACDV